MSTIAAPWFNVRKAAQVAAYFALRAGGAVNILKLVKLIYLADRTFIEKYDYPMLNDEFVSMDHGPVNSRTLDYINGMQLDGRGEWDEFVSPRAGYDIGLAHPDITLETLDEFSKADLEVLGEIWARFGHYDKYRLRDYTHRNCPEWEDPKGASQPIPYERLYQVLGKTNAAELVDDVKAQRSISRAFVSRNSLSAAF